MGHFVILRLVFYSRNGGVNAVDFVAIMNYLAPPGPCEEVRGANLALLSLGAGPYTRSLFIQLEHLRGVKVTVQTCSFPVQLMVSRCETIDKVHVVDKTSHSIYHIING